MKIKIFTYAVEDFLFFEQELNQLSQAGYNPETVGRITFFKKSERKYYHVSPFLPTATKRKEIAREKIDWINNLVEEGFEYVGKMSGMYVFASDEYLEKKLRYDHLGEYFQKGQVFKRIMSAVVTLILGVLLSLAIYRGEVSQYYTNGRIFLRGVLYLTVAGIVFYNIINLKLALGLAKRLDNREENLILNDHRLFSVLRKTIIVSLPILFGIGLFWDNYDNDRYLDDYDQIFTITDLVAGSEIVDEQYTTNHSYLIPYSYSLYQQAGEVNYDQGELGDILKVNYYRFSDVSLQKRIFSSYLVLEDENLSSMEEIESGVFLGYDRDLGFASNLYINRDDVCVIVYTNFDLEQNDRIETIMAEYLVLN